MKSISSFPPRHCNALFSLVNNSTLSLTPFETSKHSPSCTNLPYEAYHAHLLIKGSNSPYLYSRLISFYVQCGQISDARHLFEEMPHTNTRRWTILIGAYSRHGFYKETLGLFHELLKEGVRPNEYMLPSILKACANLTDLKTGEKVHCICIRFWLDSDAFISSALVDMYSKCGWIDNARRVFDRILDKDLVAWNAMVSGYAQQGFVRDAWDLVEEMRLVGMKPDSVTWNALIAGFAQVGDHGMALNLFRIMRDNGVEPGVFSWTSIIAGLVQNFRIGDALNVFRQMVVAGVQPNSVTISSLLPACASVADSRHGMEIHGYAVVVGVEEDVFVSSSLVDMYAKCGFIFEAVYLFDKMRERTTVTWNSMIFGYANHGYCNEAINLFNRMMLEGDVKPDHLTFTAVIMACCHAGMVDLGQNLFNLMQNVHGIKPRLEHYAGMVDLLGRAGKLFEAYDLIKTMPVEPDSIVWGALLGSCRNHGNVELAELAALHLSKLEPDSAGSSVLLSNVFAEAGRWGDAARLKMIVKKRRLRRSPGCSWIEAT
ncbi:tetratricopeptide repeat (TPR)-like superfamily protein [Tasmannia lanceolata]|uniref:tetratricopeptide repeat (TPR)-like superfamily protein n=1 Tax=Tasmannia lanceolata TaxID=3420 RepID=UPI004064B967